MNVGEGYLCRKCGPLEWVCEKCGTLVSLERIHQCEAVPEPELKRDCEHCQLADRCLHGRLPKCFIPSSLFT